VRGIKAVVAYLFAAGFFFLILVYFADFPMRQGFILVLMWASLTRAVELLARRPAGRFSPYYVRVDPNWYDLLMDFKLTSKPEDWQAIRKSFEESPSTEYRVLRNGICFTVVHQSEDFERTLIYLDNHQTFVSEVDLQEELEPIRIEPEDKLEREFGRLNKSDVRLFVRFGGDGYNLGIRVPRRWWDKMKTSCPKPMEEHADHPTGQVDLVLATISYREFDLYWEPVQWSSTFYDKTAKQLRSRRDEQRTRFDWKTIEHDSDLGSELGIDWPESIEHKYFTVEHRAI
jgi:hypothetical protein